MPLDGLIFDRRHDLVAVDFFLVYQVNTAAHAQLYGRGLMRRIRWLVPMAEVRERYPGIIHIPLSDYRQYETGLAAMIREPSRKLQRRATVELMRKSIRNVARANWHFERRATGDSIENLLASAVEAMAFYNFNDETDLLRLLESMTDRPELADSLRSAVSPQVTPYMVLLGARAASYQTTGDNLSRCRWIHGASFLTDFDAVSVETEDAYVARPGAYSLDGARPISDLCMRRQARQKAFMDLERLTTAWCLERRELFLDAAALAAVAADHEEARHYWQARTMKNIRSACAAMGLDLQTADHDILSRAWKEELLGATLPR